MYRILIIDDEYYFRQAIKKYLLQAEGCVVCGEANNGQDGLEMIQTLQPDITLVDINMPDLNGIELITRAREVHRNIHFIIITGYGRFEYAQQAVKLGVLDYLLKPVEPEELLGCVKRVCALIEEEQQQASRYQALKDEMSVAMDRLQDNFLSRLIHGDIDSSDLVQVKENGLFHLDARYAVMLVRIRFVESPSYWEESERSLCNQAALNLLEELFPNHLIPYRISDHRQNICFVIAADGLKNDDLLPCVEHLTKKANGLSGELLHFSLRVALGGIYGDLKEVAASYREALSAMEAMLCYGTEGFLPYARLQADTSHFSLYPEIQRTLLGGMRAQSQSVVGDIVRSAVRDMRDAWAHPHQVYQFVQEMIKTDHAFRSEFGEKPQDAAELHGYVNNVFGLSDHFQLETALCNCLYRSMSDILTLKQKKKGIILVEGVHAYVHSCYMDSNIKISDIAETLFVNTQHLCAVYKRETGKTIGAYLLNVRMQKAKENFDRGQANINLCAKSTGYEDSNYFSKCFKKYFGVSPSHYLSLKEVNQRGSRI